MIDLAQLAKLALGQLRGRELDVVEEHVFACGRCASVLEHLFAIGDAVQVVVASGSTMLALSDPLLGALQAADLVTRTYRLGPSQIVACSATAADLYVLTTLEADLHAVERVDMVQTSAFGELRMPDVPFDSERGLVQFVAPGALLRQLPTGRISIELFAVDPQGERKLSEYFLDHTATIAS